MIYIAHRGNTHGPNIKRENSPDYILEALNNGFYVEIDVWIYDAALWLGHDGPEYKTNIDFLKSSDKFICHAKNIPALELLLKENVHCFFHDTDEAVLTSKGWIWTYPGKLLTKNSICVMPEVNKTNFTNNCIGICSDYVSNLRS